MTTFFTICDSTHLLYISFYGIHNKHLSWFQWSHINSLASIHNNWNLYIHFYCITFRYFFVFFNQIFSAICCKGLIEKSSLVQIMAWCQTDNRPFSEPMITQFINAYALQQPYIHELNVQWLSGIICNFKNFALNSCDMSIYNYAHTGKAVNVLLKK